MTESKAFHVFSQSFNELIISWVSPLYKPRNKYPDKKTACRTYWGYLFHPTIRSKFYGLYLGQGKHRTRRNYRIGIKINQWFTNNGISPYVVPDTDNYLYIYYFIHFYSFIILPVPLLFHFSHILLRIYYILIGFFWRFVDLLRSFSFISGRMANNKSYWLTKISTVQGE